MKSRMYLRLGLALAVVLSFGVTRSSASFSPSLFEFDLTTDNLGGKYGSGPFVHVKVEQTADNKATITFTSLTAAVGPTPDKYVYMLGDGGTAGFNLDAKSWTLSPITVTRFPDATNFTTPSPSDGGKGNEDGFGKFNQTIDNGSGATDAVSSMSVTVTNTGGDWAGADKVLTKNENGALAAAHIFVFAITDLAKPDPNAKAGALKTGYVAGDGTEGGNGIQSTPAPPSAVLVGVGVLSLLGFTAVRRRRRRAPAVA